MILVFELILILILVFVNGFFSAAEIAVVTIRKTRIKELIKKKVTFARILERMKENIETFFIIIQLGVTIVGTLASVIAGTISIKYITPIVSGWLGDFSGYAEAVSVAIVTIVITTMFLFFGELLPKSIATRSPEGIGLLAAPVIDIFSKILKPFVMLIHIPHKFLVRLIANQKVYSESRISEDEIRLIIEEGVSSGVLERQEQELIEHIFGFTDKTAKDIMIDINSVDMIDIAASKDEIIDRIIASGHNRFPVYEKNRDNIIGIVSARDFYYVYFQSEVFILRDIIRKPLFVYANTKISLLLRDMQKKKMHMAIVQQEERVIGIITLEDIIEEIVGEIEDERFIKKIR